MTTKPLLALLLAALPLYAAEKKLNIIAIVADDQAAWTVSSYGGKNLQTPNMDRLGKTGARFSQAYVNTPVCSPSRATYLTGRYPTETGITDWITEPQGKRCGLTKDLPTWPEILRSNGYHTALIGKWHLGLSDASQPSANGFDEFFGNLSGGWKPKNPVFRDQANATYKLTGDSVNIVTEKAIEFLGKKHEQPFALLVHYREPHGPYLPMPTEDEEALKSLDPEIPDYPGLKKKEVKEATRGYLTSVRALDRNLGLILDEVKKRGLEDNTIIVFTSDHGYNLGRHGIHSKGNGSWMVEGKKGCRPNLFDTSLAVPLFVRWPGVTKPGTVVNAVTSNVDMLPSVLGMLGVNKPEGLVQHGMDFSPWLRGQSPKWRDALFLQYPMVNEAKDSMRGIRTADWKLVRHYQVEGKDELYDLKNDPGELNNLYDDAGSKATRDKLQGRLDEWMKELKDDPQAPSPQKNPNP